MFLTIFTPTFNREKHLKKLYESLKKQTVKNFEWIVVDDGSNDNTYEYLKQISNEPNEFNIQIHRQNNQGKHVAINKGLDLANGELFFIVDSDDLLLDNSVELIFEVFEKLKQDNNFRMIGISGLKGYSQFEKVGETYSGNDFLIINNLERKRHGIHGDRAEVYLTDVLRKNKFPVFEDEKFISEAIVWNKLAYEGNVLCFFNDIIYICEYQDDGLSSNIDDMFLKNWQGYTAYVKSEIKYRTRLIEKISIIYSYYYLAKFKKCMKLKDIKKDNLTNDLILLLVYVTLPLYKRFRESNKR